MKNRHFYRWLIQAPAGLVCIGAGLCLTIDAGFQKLGGQPWFWYGTFALIVFNSGLCIFGDSILHKWRSEQQQLKKQD